MVREALNEDTLRSIQRLINLSPAAIAALEDDLTSPDSRIRQTACKLVLQYTVGHPALVKKEDDDSQGGLVVNFALPRPDVPEVHVAEAIEAIEATGDAVCDNCERELPAKDFVSGSERCVDCFNSAQAEQQALLERTS